MTEELFKKLEEATEDQYAIIEPLEPGYDKPIVLVENWNEVLERYPDLDEELEKAGFDVDWWENWILDEDGTRGWRCEPTSPFWEPRYFIAEDGLPADIEENIEEYIGADGRRVVPSYIEDNKLVELGYKKIIEETSDRNKMEEAKADKNLLAKVVYIDPFRATFSIWKKTKGE